MTGERPVLTPRAGWLRSPVHDLLMAFIWVPFAAATLVASDDPERLRWLVAATVLFSFAHQPLTLWLAYGDGEQCVAHRTLFFWAPLGVATAVLIGSSVSPEAIALVAGAWNAGHTIRQRYGVSRLYGRLGGIDCAGDNRLLWSWLVVSVLIAIAATNLRQTARDVGLSPRNMTSIDALASVHAVAVFLVPVAILIAAVLTVRAARDEWTRRRHSAARLVYLGSTAMLLALLAVRPVVGFVAYVGSHAAEYLLMVRWRLGRAAQRSTTGDRVGAVARRIGSGGTIALYAVAVTVLIVAVRAVRGSLLATTVVLTIGALHFLYDGVLWRSPRRATPRVNRT
jgi:hypothetical protein